MARSCPPSPPSASPFLPRPSQARSPDPNCNGEVMALYLLLEYTQSAEQCGQDADVQVGGADNIYLYI